jgi:glycerol kinase
VGIWHSTDEIRRQWTLDKEYVPSMDAQQRISLLKGWNKAVVRAKRWAALEDEE